MKTHIITFFLFAGTILQLQGQEEYPCPPNGNAESGNFTNWVTFTSTAQNPQNLNAFSQNFDANRFGVHNSTSTFTPGGFGGQTMLINGIDQFGNFSVPSEGNNCFRIGNSSVGGEAEAMKYTFTVTNQNKIFRFRFALILEDGGHPAGDNPKANFYFIKGPNISPSFASIPLYLQTYRSFVADLNDPYYNISENNSGVVYREWECVEYDLSAYLGQQVSFVAKVRDCTQGAHFGYMYLDGLCTNWPATASATINNNIFCTEEDIIIDGAASEGEDRYYLEVAEGNQYGMVLNGFVAGQWFIAEEVPDNLNVSDFLASQNKKVECGKEYIVKIAVANQCAPWNEVTFPIQIVCPEVNAGSDVFECCGEGVFTDPYVFGDDPIAGNTYSWVSVPPGFTANTSSFSLSTPPLQSTAYIVEMTQPDGCIGWDTVLYSFLPTQFGISLTSEYKLCDYQPYVSAHLAAYDCAPDLDFLEQYGDNSYYEADWYFKPDGSSTYNFIQSGSSTIHAPNADGTLKAILFGTNCSSSDAEATMQIHHRPGGHLMIVDNTASPLDGSGQESVLHAPARIFEFGPFAPINIGEGPAYGISDFKLTIRDRWGHVVKIVTKATVGRAPHENVMQGDIIWDGTKPGYGRVQDGVYNYTLDLLYCGETEFVNVKVDDYSEYNACINTNWLGNCTLYMPGWIGFFVVLN